MLQNTKRKTKLQAINRRSFMFKRNPKNTPQYFSNFIKINHYLVSEILLKQSLFISKRGM